MQGKSRFLAALLCIGLTVNILGCGDGCSQDINPLAVQPNVTADTLLSQKGVSDLLSGSASSPVYSSSLQVDNGKDQYMAAIRENLVPEAPAAYLEYAETLPEDTPSYMTSRSFLGRSAGGLFTKWFWQTADGKVTGRQEITASDIYGANVSFEADAKPYSPDPEKTGMVVSVGGMSGMDGYVLRNLGGNAGTPDGISIIGEKGILLQRYEIPHEVGDGDMMSDKDFNLYVIDENRTLHVYHPNGTEIMTDTDNMGKASAILTAFPDGSVGCFCTALSFESQGEIQVGTLYQPDLETGENVLLTRRTENTYFLTAFDENSLLYADEKGIYRSDYNLQEEEALYLWENHGLHVSKVLRMSAEPDGSIDIIICTYQDDLYFLHLIPTPEETETMEISFAVSVSGRQQYLESVNRFNREHPAYLITLEVYEEAKLLTELTAGKGPVLVDTNVIDFVSNRKLWENLEGKLTEWKLQDQLLDKPMMGGLIDGEQYGLVFSWDIISFLTNCYEEENWDYESFLKYIKNNDSLQKIFPEQTPQNFMELFLLRSLDDSLFVDTAGVNAYFDTGIFLSAAELAKGLETDELPEERSDQIPKIRAGNYLGDIAYLNCPDQIAYYREIYGEHVNFIGFPGREGSCHFIRTADPVAVRSSASEEEKQVAFWFLSGLLDTESQRSLGTSGFSVREDIFMEQLKEPAQRSQYVIGGETFTVSADWTTVKEELLALYEKCVPYPVMPDAVEAAISEELRECFYGSKSIPQVGEILQNRIQLYLDER